MTKEEARLSVMGAISMALKSSTLQQGFEIICKNLSELETENADLKKGLSVVNASNSFNKEQLTEAKKIIGNLYAICKDNPYPNRSVLMEQAERFLKE